MRNIHIVLRFLTIECLNFDSVNVTWILQSLGFCGDNFTTFCRSTVLFLFTGCFNTSFFCQRFVELACFDKICEPFGVGEVSSDAFPQGFLPVEVFDKNLSEQLAIKIPSRRLHLIFPLVAISVTVYQVINFISVELGGCKIRFILNRATVLSLARNEAMVGR